MKELVTAVLICVLLVITIAILGESAPEVTARQGESYIRTLVFEFQTLITGVLAVSAAALTIWQMQKTDKEQERRHSEAMLLSREADRRRLERAINPQLDDMKAIRDQVTEIDMDPTRFSTMKGDAYWHTLTDIAPSYRNALAELDRVMQRKQFTDADTLFNGKTTRQLETLFELIPRAIGILDHHSEAENSEREPTWYHEYDAEFDGLERFRPLKAIPEQLQSVIVELEAARDRMMRNDRAGSINSF